MHASRHVQGAPTLVIVYRPHYAEVSHMVAVFTVAASLLSAAFGGLSTVQQPASISGFITDTTGRGLPGATITVVSEDGARRPTVTDSAGRYRIDGLTPGRYSVEASMAGFDTKATVMRVSSGSGALWSGALLIAPAIGEMSIERQVMRFTGSEAIDCGRYTALASEATLRRSLTCALTSAGTRRPFSVIAQFAAGVTRGSQGLFAGPDGVIQLFEYEKGDVSFRLKPCPSPRVTRRPNRPRTGFEFTCQALPL